MHSIRNLSLAALMSVAMAGALSAQTVTAVQGSGMILRPTQGGAPLSVLVKNAQGQPVSGQIVDGSDIDFYQIRSAPGGTIRIHVATDSGSLIPALDVYDMNKKLLGEKLASDYSFTGQPNATYYIQVSGQRNTTGNYTLTVGTGESGQ